MDGETQASCSLLLGVDLASEAYDPSLRVVVLVFRKSGALGYVRLGNGIGFRVWGLGSSRPHAFDRFAASGVPGWLRGLIDN